MDKETLFKAIQRREVVLWAGAGFSRYAGFKLGAGVVHHLFDTLSTAQQQARAFYPLTDAQGYPAMALPAFASLYVNLHNGQAHALRREVSKLFTKRPTSLKTHQQLASIPFIEHIVTTNFDTLFEQAYGNNKLHVVTNGTQLSYQEFSKITLYKVHGSIENLNSLVLTEEDYRAFYTKADKLLWGYIESLMATRTLLFVGYGLEDPNVLGLFEQLLDTLGSNMRTAYLVAPGLNPVNVDRLRRRNVVYIDSTGEALVEELLQYLKDTAIPDLKKGRGTVDHTAQFLRDLGMLPTFQATSQGYSIKELKSTSSRPLTNFSLDLPVTGRELFQQFLAGTTGVALKLTAEELAEATFRVERVNLGFSDQELWLVRQPFKEKVVDIEFADGTYVSDVELKLYQTPTTIRLLASIKEFAVQVTILRQEITDSGYSFHLNLIRRQEYYDSLDSLRMHGKLMQALSAEQQIKCWENGQCIWQEQLKSYSPVYEQGVYLQLTTAQLEAVQMAFAIKFRRFKLRIADLDVLHRIVPILNKTTFRQRWDGKTECYLEVGRFKEILKKVRATQEITAESANVIPIQLLGWQLQIAVEVYIRIFKPRFKKCSAANTYEVKSGSQEIEMIYAGEYQLAVVEAATPEPITAPMPVEFLDQQLLK